MRSAIAGLCLAGAGAACAESGPRDSGLAAEVTLVSDYRFRGVSYTGGKPALQGGLDFTAGSGWLAGVWASATLGRVRGAGEVDIYAGRAGTLAGLDYAIAGYAYLERSLRKLQYVELQATLARKLGAVSIQTEASLAPRQSGGPANLYLGLTGRAPIRGDGPAVVLHGGYEDGLVRRKIDWGAGVECGAEGFIMSASVVGSTVSRRSGDPHNTMRGGAALVARVSRSF